MVAQLRLQNKIFHGRRKSVALVFDGFMIAVLAFVFTANSPIFAANHSITGGTYGPNCNSGGYFTPSTLTISKGDTVTISVPSNDQYAGGLEVHGFPEGNFTIARGASHTTNALTSSVSYYGTWPSSGCHKGNGTITVSSPTPPPAPTPPPPSPTPGPTSHPSPTPAPVPTPAAGAASQPSSASHPAPSPAPGKTHSSTTKSTAESQSAGTNQPAAGSSAQPVSASNASAKKPASHAGIAIGSVAVAAGIIGWLVWQFVIRPKKV